LKGIEMKDPIAMFFSIALVITSVFLLGALRYGDMTAVLLEQHVPMAAYLFAAAFLVIGTATTALSCGRRVRS
jgi:hypothetical protein